MLSKTIIAALAIVAILAVSTQVQGSEIAGLKPDQRPTGAPVVTEYPKSKEWYVKALTGIEPPYPRSLYFLDDQGAWYWPFIHPGMTGRYDIRGWHTTKQ